ICMSSVHEVIPWAGHVNYAASKGGVMLMMKSIAQEVAPHRIRVNSVCPGAVRTPINMEAWGTPEAYRELMKLIPYKRIGEPDDIGRALVLLASDDADYIHGASIFVDGGMTLYPGFETGGQAAASRFDQAVELLRQHGRHSCRVRRPAHGIRPVRRGQSPRLLQNETWRRGHPRDR